MIGGYNGMQVQIVDAQKQARTAKDVRVAWLRPRVPSKAAGRRGTRRAWKRANPPHWLLAYREPTDVLVLFGRTIVATSAQYVELQRAIPARPLDRSPW